MLAGFVPEKGTVSELHIKFSTRSDLLTRPTFMTQTVHKVFLSSSTKLIGSASLSFPLRKWTI